ncbi:MULTISPECIES: DUF3087 family protein [unclassified Oceanobacter]|uniref:DUF3087 family protein n=1 Tax=unclassified Oceanobacter TaxID=2620260 RepID=UPI0026E20EBF|nr:MULTISPECIES: DUF3087 family protein [unclassified Oceanobacter]MDO6682083.1 DUF3087 family protein [Oceanobacter sp. 5_MG-2023]MDP2505522.1 DUF3087 family protein [Oceanobacter sp. 3_MG-2023]MDP2547097.1 DUF3087 family protein [Oceanobacter sp. 4_MG-2023]MDP2609722.1 DUF3087 family protein [Oceanobacter sp. 1_MG-2023]MDP2613053.1 DUF3087 family protein [Oceanobacter sp. 2_MG-2023]
MQLRPIDKSSYKKRLNQVQGGAVVALLVLALLFSELYRGLWANGESSTWLNALAVATAAGLVGLVFNIIKDKPWMADVVYLWRLKQELNRIYRSSKLIEQALADGDREAFVIQNFNLRGAKLLYTAEDNTLTLPELQEKIIELEATLAERQLTVSVDEYSPALLDAFKQRLKSGV